MGAFNIQGVAPGHHLTPIEESQRRRISEWMKDALEASNLRVVETPATHAKGAALDIHTTKDAHTYKTKVHTFEGKFSDHRMPIVKTNLQIEVPIHKGHKVPEKVKCIRWVKDRKLWCEAMGKDRRLMDMQAQVFEAVARRLNVSNTHKDVATKVVDLMTLPIHVTITMLGHRYSLTKGGKDTPEGGDNKEDATFLLEDAIEQHKEAKHQAE